MATLDDSGGVSGADIPTTVPASFYAQAQGDMLNQQAAADAAANNFQAQVLSDHVGSLGQIADIKQLDQQMQPARNASQYIGSNAWGSGHNTYCETFAEQMTDGKNMGASAADAFGNRLKSGQAVADPSLQGVQPGNLVYFGGAQENGGYGHVGVYAGNGRIVSATVNGIQNYPISAFNAPVVGYAQTGGGGGGMGTIGENTGGGSGVNMNAPAEGGDNPPPPQVSDGSWAPPSADSLKDWFGTQVSKIFSATSDAATGVRTALGAGDQNAASNPAPTMLQEAPGAVADAAMNPLGAGVQVVNAVNDLSGSDQPPAPTPDQAEATGVLTPQQAGAAKIMGNVVSGGPEGLAAPVAGAVDLAKAGAGVVRAVPDIVRDIPNAIPNAITDWRTALNALPGEAAASGPGTMQAAASESGPISNALGAVRQAVLSKFDPAALTPPSMQDRIAQYANDMLGANQRGETMARTVRDLSPGLNINDAIDYERTGNLLSDMTPEEQAKNDAIRATINSTGDMLKQRGLVTEDVTQPGAQLGQSYLPGMTPNGPAHYFPHLLNGDSGYEDVVGRTSFNPKDYFSRQREFPDLAQAYEAGYDLKAPVDEVLGEHVASANQAAARQDLIEGVKSDPAVALPSADAPRDWVRGGSLDDTLRGFSVEPNSAKALNNLLIAKPSNFVDSINSTLKESNLALSGFHAGTMIHQTWRVAMAAGRPLDAIPIISQGLRNLVSDKAYQAFYMKHPEMFEGAADTGTTMLARGRSPDVGPLGMGTTGQMIARALVGGATGGLTTNAAAQKLDPENVGRDTLAGIVAGAGANVALTPAMNEALFGRFIPTLKVLSHDMASDAFGPEAASRMANDGFGGQNLLATARNPGFQRLLHLTVLAPDWMESWMRMAGRSVTGGASGDAARKYWATTLTSAMLGLEATNYALTGHLTVDSPLGPGNESGRELQLDVTPILDGLRSKGVPGTDTGSQHVYIDPLSLGPVTGLESAIRNRDPGSFASGRLSVLGKIGSSVMANEDYKGAHIVPPGTPLQEAFPKLAAYGIAQDVPIGEQTLGNDKSSPAEKVVSIATGMRTGRGPAWQPGYSAPSSRGGRGGYGGFRGYGGYGGYRAP